MLRIKHVAERAFDEKLTSVELTITGEIPHESVREIRRLLERREVVEVTRPGETTRSDGVTTIFPQGGP